MGSPWRDKISLAILELQEKGEIQMMYDRWWKNTGNICSRDDKMKDSKANALGVNNIGGVFVVLLCGLAFAVLIAILEFCHSSKRNQKHFAYIDNMCAGDGVDTSTLSIRNLDEGEMYLQRQSLFSHMTDELCLAIRCQGSQQRTAFKRQCSKCRQIQKRSQQPINQAPNAQKLSTRRHINKRDRSAINEIVELKDFYENSI